MQNVAVFVDDELAEVPLDEERAAEARRGLREVLVEGVGICAVDVDLAEDRKLRIRLFRFVFRILLDLRVA